MSRTGSGAKATTSPAITRRRRKKRDCIRLWDIRWPVFGICRVYINSGVLWTFSLPRHAHYILRDIHTNGAAEGMVIEGDIASAICTRDVAGIIGGMPNVSTATIAWDILHNVRVGRRKLICLLHSHWRGLYLCRQLVKRHHVKVRFLLC